MRRFGLCFTWQHRIVVLDKGRIVEEGTGRALNSVKPKTAACRLRVIMQPLSKTKQIYHAFGLNIASAIPFLDMPQTEGIPDVIIAYGKTPASLSDPKINGVRYQAGPGEFLLRVDNVARYYVTNGSHILVERESGTADEEVLLFLMGSIMGAILHQRNILPLHGSSVEVDGEGVIFVGPSSIGKSTLAGAFHKRAYPVLADDVCAVTAENSGRPHIIPGFPRLKLWADALKKLEEDRKGLNRVRLDQAFEKYFVPFDNACDKPTPVRSVFVLHTTNTDKFEVVSLERGDKIEPIINNTFRPQFLEGLGGKKEHFKQCAAVAARAAVIRITRPRKGFRLNELMDLLERNW